MWSSKIVVFVGVLLGGRRSSRFRSSEEEILNLKYPRRVKSVCSLGQFIKCLVGRLQRDITGSCMHQET